MPDPKQPKSYGAPMGFTPPSAGASAGRPRAGAAQGGQLSAAYNTYMRQQHERFVNGVKQIQARRGPMSGAPGQVTQRPGMQVPRGQSMLGGPRVDRRNERGIIDGGG